MLKEKIISFLPYVEILEVVPMIVLHSCLILLMMALMPFYLAQTLMEFEERCCFLVVEMMLEVLIWHGTRSGPENQKYMIIIIY